MTECGDLRCPAARTTSRARAYPAWRLVDARAISARVHTVTGQPRFTSWALTPESITRREIDGAGAEPYQTTEGESDSPEGGPFRLIGCVGAQQEEAKIDIGLQGLHTNVVNLSLSVQ